MTTKLPVTCIIVRLSTGQDVIGKSLLTPQLRYFFDKEFDFGCCPQSIYLLKPRFMTNAGSPVLSVYNAWDSSAEQAISICLQQIISISVPTITLQAAYCNSITEDPILDKWYRAETMPKISF